MYSRDFNPVVAHRLRDLRVRHLLSVSAAAKWAGVTTHQWRQWEGATRDAVAAPDGLLTRFAIYLEGQP